MIATRCSSVVKPSGAGIYSAGKRGERQHTVVISAVVLRPIFLIGQELPGTRRRVARLRSTRRARFQASRLTYSPRYRDARRIAHSGRAGPPATLRPHPHPNRVGESINSAAARTVISYMPRLNSTARKCGSGMIFGINPRGRNCDVPRVSERIAGDGHTIAAKTDSKRCHLDSFLSRCRRRRHRWRHRRGRRGPFRGPVLLTR